ncbi:hypothetical protein [Deinococcus sonorensis]|uniref:Uncharacterized protein n=2 Tax=Deinococcus sonorensis TaxID=309891 RepID=A0AAU7UD36_9DEIO
MTRMLPLCLLLLSSALAATALPKLTFDAGLLGVQATVRSLPATPRRDEPDFFPPAHLTVRLGPDNGALHELNVYPVAGLLAQYPERPGEVRPQLDRLKTLLQTRRVPPLASELPFLPLVPAGQVLHAAVAYLNFPGGHGVRYLTAYSQEVAPVTRQQVFYTFQGLSDDGRAYVSFQYDLNLKELPQDVTSAADRALLQTLMSPDTQRVQTAWNSYLTRTVKRLDALTQDPRLTRLDRFVRSVQLR